MKFSMPLLALAALLLLTACYTVTLDARSLDGVVSLNPQPQHATLKHFHVQSTSHHLIYGLVEFAQADLAGEIRKEVKAAGGVGAANVVIKSEYGFVDLLLNWLTAGIYNPITVSAEGDIVGE